VVIITGGFVFRTTTPDTEFGQRAPPGGRETREKTVLTI
jgi:hypothetical protein